MNASKQGLIPLIWLLILGSVILTVVLLSLWFITSKVKEPTTQPSPIPSPSPASFTPQPTGGPTTTLPDITSIDDTRWQIPLSEQDQLQNSYSKSALGCRQSAINLTPLVDLTSGNYYGYSGGLYPNSSNTPPQNYLNEALALAKQIKPLDRSGKSDPNGKIVVLSVGMSNATMEFQSFIPKANSDSSKNPKLVPVDGAQNGFSSDMIAKNADAYFNGGTATGRRGQNAPVEGVAKRLQAAGVTESQVQVVWFKTALPGVKLELGKDQAGFELHAGVLKEYSRQVVEELKNRYPNLKIIYLASRIYAGYAKAILSPEPFAYQGGFAMKWLIEDRINGKISGPWIGWGPYLWADGSKARSDGLTWQCSSDFSGDGTHPSKMGTEKVADLLLNFFKTDPTAKDWFLK